jgi:hypothetical protein
MLPVLASSAAIPQQVVTLTFSPLWVPLLFVAALTLTCAALWFLAGADRAAHRTAAVPAPIRLAFVRPLHGEHGSRAA